MIKLKEVLHLILSSAVFTDSKWIDTNQAKYVALGLAAFSILLSSIHIIRHLKNYTMPQVQVYVIRILFTCPVYAITSSIALMLGPYGTYAEVIRDVYEPFVIYSFLNLILEYAGGETDCVYLIENEPPLKMPCPLCLMKSRPRDTRLMRFCHRGVLQFIITKPIVALFDVIMLAVGLYYSEVYQIIEIVVYNISYGWALYCLFVFYLATKSVIKNFKPIAKFSTVKAIVFATYYQSMILKLSLSTPQNAIKWNDFLLCLEMVIFALLLMIAFPVKEFLGGIPDRRVLQNVKEVFTVRDIYQDVCNNFNNKYKDYALQKSQSETPVTVSMEEYFPKNMNSVAMQMTERYRGRSKRFAFNSLLRGTRPVKAGLRRHNRDNNTESDLYHSVEEGGGSAHVSDNDDSDGDDGRIHDAGEVFSGDEIDAERQALNAPERVHIGRLTLATKKKSPVLRSSNTSKNIYGSSPVESESLSGGRIVNLSALEVNAGDETFSPLIRSPSSISDDQVLLNSPTAGLMSPSSSDNLVDSAVKSPKRVSISATTPITPKSTDSKRLQPGVLTSPSNDWSDFVEA